jgi:beta-galactosidase
MGAELQRAGEKIEGTQVTAPVAMLLSYDSRFAFQVQPNNPGYSYPEHFHSVYRAFHRRNIPVDVLSPTDDLSGYKLVLAPPLYVLPRAVAANLERYVREGGTLVCFFRSGVKDQSNAVVDQPLPGLLAQMCGVEVSEYDSLPEGATNGLRWTIDELEGAAPGVALAWADILAPNGAEVIAEYTQDYYAGQPAITSNRYGEGKAIYVGMVGDEATHATLADWLIRSAGLTAPLEVPPGVEVTMRSDGSRRLMFVLNHTDAPQRVTLNRAYRNVVGETARLEGAVELGPYDVWLLEESD